MISMEKALAEDLFNSKLFLIRQEINKILKKWKFDSAEKLIQLTREGELEEAEVDAISLTNLLKNLEKYEQLKINMG